jgi:hypothetical protein
MVELKSSLYAALLRQELGARNREWARGRAHVESYGNPPVVVYCPNDHPADEDLSAGTLAKSGPRHGNFFDGAYGAITARADWMRRFDKIHTGQRSLPKAESGRRWRELDSSMSSDALLMNVFCTPGVVAPGELLGALGVDSNEPFVFGWKARVPLANGRVDRTEVDLRLGSLLIEAKLTEADFQTREARIVEAYRDFDAVFDRELLPRVAMPTRRRRQVTEFPEEVSQEFESYVDQAERGPGLLPGMEASAAAAVANSVAESVAGYASYQLIRNVLAAYAEGCSFCVIHDERRPDLRESWFQVMAAVKQADMRVRLKVLTWQELAGLAPEGLQEFLALKYGIAAAGRSGGGEID